MPRGHRISRRTDDTNTWLPKNPELSRHPTIYIRFRVPPLGKLRHNRLSGNVWERASNESIDGLLRRFSPKGTDPSSLS